MEGMEDGNAMKYEGTERSCLPDKLIYKRLCFGTT